jgi:glycosyltransferase involved in cell wall biosynthesis
MEIKLSILIATTSARREKIKPLLATLQHQVFHKGKYNVVEVLVNNNETDCIGKKRNDLLQLAKGKFVSFIDSDDMISPNYVLKILTLIDCYPTLDCIGINGVITTNGADERKWYISKEYGHWFQRGNEYFRTPNHISPIRRELALIAGFPEVKFAEDAEFSRRVLHLLKHEERITEPMYFYNYRDDNEK